MNEQTYKVVVDNEVIAKSMTLHNALILVEALFSKWYNEVDTAITVQREDDLKCCEGT